MTPQAWYDYAARTLEREQKRDNLPKLVKVDITTFGDDEPQILEVWEAPDDRSWREGSR